MSLLTKGPLPVMTLADLDALGYRIVADPQTPLIAAYAAWKQTYADLARGCGVEAGDKPEWGRSRRRCWPPSTSRSSSPSSARRSRRKARR
jgi:hypothetical protein